MTIGCITREIASVTEGFRHGRRSARTGQRIRQTRLEGYGFPSEEIQVFYSP